MFIFNSVHDKRFHLAQRFKTMLMDPPPHRAVRLRVCESIIGHATVDGFPVHRDRSHPHRKLIDGIVSEWILSVYLAQHPGRHQRPKRCRGVMKFRNVNNGRGNRKLMLKEVRLPHPADHSEYSATKGVAYWGA